MNELFPKEAVFVISDAWGKSDVVLVLTVYQLDDLEQVI